MSSRFSKRITILPGLRLNIGKRGISTTIGPHGFSLGIGKKGIYSNVGITGTGLSYRTKLVDGKWEQRHHDDENQLFKLVIDENFNLLILDEDGNNLSPSLERKVKRNNKLKLLSFLEDYAENFNQELKLSITQHLLTPLPNETLFTVPDFELVKPEPPLYKRKGFISKIFLFGSLIDKRNAKLQQYYDEELAEWNNQWQLYLTHKKEFLEQLYQAQTGHTDAMYKTLQNLMHEIKWEKKTNLSFDFNKTGNELAIDIDLPEIEDIPNKEAYVIERGLRLNVKHKSAKETRADYQKCVFSILFRVTGLSFCALPTLNQVDLAGYTQRLNNTTGQIEDFYIVSVRIKRNQWEQLNFDNLENIDPFLAFQTFNFKCHVEKNGDFSRIEPFSREGFN